MLTPSMAPVPSPSQPPQSPQTAEQPRSDILGAAARLAAAATRAPVGLVCLGVRGVAVWGPGLGVSSQAQPAADGNATLHLVPALVARPDASRNIRDLGDDPDFGGVLGLDGTIDGLVSVATATVRDASGATLGLVGAFDRVPRDWGYSDLDQLDGVAELLSQSAPSARQAAATRAVAETIEGLERSLGAGSVQALVEVAARSDDAALRRRASEAQTSIDRASLLRGRLRAALRSTPFAGPKAGVFDLVSTTERAVGEVSRRRRTAPLPVSSAEPHIPVHGDPQRAAVAISRCVAAALAASGGSDVAVQVSTRARQSDRLDGSVVGELSITVKGAALGANELSRVVAGLHGAEPADINQTSVQLHFAGGEARLVAPGFDATATPHGTWVTLRWPIDLG
jgi:hypothetical protein